MDLIIRRVTTVLFVLLILALAVFGQQPPAQAPPATPSKYLPSDVQSLRLQVKQKDAQLAQMAFNVAQQQLRQAFVDLQAESERIKAENKWPKEAQFDPNSLTFSEPPAPAKAPEAKKP